MSDIVKKLTPWMPLLIVAGYFVFLIATWMKYTSNLKSIKQDLKAVVIDGSERAGNDSDK